MWTTDENRSPSYSLELRGKGVSQFMAKGRRLCGFGTEKGEGDQTLEIYADVIFTRPLVVAEWARDRPRKGVIITTSRWGEEGGGTQVINLLEGRQPRCMPTTKNARLKRCCGNEDPFPGLIFSTYHSLRRFWIVWFFVFRIVNRAQSKWWGRFAFNNLRKWRVELILSQMLFLGSRKTSESKG